MTVVIDKFKNSLLNLEVRTMEEQLYCFQHYYDYVGQTSGILILEKLGSIGSQIGYL